MIMKNSILVYNYVNIYNHLFIIVIKWGKWIAGRKKKLLTKENYYYFWFVYSFPQFICQISFLFFKKKSFSTYQLVLII